MNIKVIAIAIAFILGFTMFGDIFMNPIIFGIQPWMVGLWSVYKFQWFIWNKSDEPDIDGEIGPFKTEAEMEYKLKKKIKEEMDAEEIPYQITEEKWIELNNSISRRWRVATKTFEIIFVPYKHD